MQFSLPSQGEEVSEVAVVGEIREWDEAKGSEDFAVENLHFKPERDLTSLDTTCTHLRRTSSG